MDVAKRFFCVIAVIMTITFVSVNCWAQEQEEVSNYSDCLDAVLDKIESLPPKEWLETLDGQRIPLKEFFAIYKKFNPKMVVPEKWYNNPSEIRELANGIKLRVYIYPVHFCGELKKRSAGDLVFDFSIAELYSPKGEFIALLLDTGPMPEVLPHPVWEYRKRQERRWKRENGANVI